MDCSILIVTDDTSPNEDCLNTFSRHFCRTQILSSHEFLEKDISRDVSDILGYCPPVSDSCAVEKIQKLTTTDAWRGVPVVYMKQNGSVCDFHIEKQESLNPVIIDFSNDDKITEKTVENLIQLARLNRQYYETHKQNEQLIAEIDAIAYSIGHELKNPLNGILGLSESMKTMWEDLEDEEKREFAGLIYSAGIQINSIIDELLILTRVRSYTVEYSPLHMGPVVSDAWERVKEMINDREVHFSMKNDWPMVTGYGPWVMEIWIQYMKNAIQHLKPPVTLECNYTLPGEDRVRFFVRDNGPALSPEIQAQLFRPLTRREDDERTRKGLGLVIVKRITQKLGGTAGMESHPAGGSVFYFELPLARENELSSLP